MKMQVKGEQQHDVMYTLAYQKTEQPKEAKTSEAEAKTRKREPKAQNILA
jgi:hypothetical protein